MRDFAVNSLGKIIFLVLQGHVPTKTELKPTHHQSDPKLIARFDRDASRHAQVYRLLHDYATDTSRIHGRPPTPDQLADKANEIWEKYETEGAAL